MFDNYQYSEHLKFMLNCTYLIIGSGQTGLILTKELIKTGEKIILVEQDKFGGSYLHTKELAKNKITELSEDFSTGLRLFKNHPDTFSVLRKLRQSTKIKIAKYIQAEADKQFKDLEENQNFKYLNGVAKISNKNLAEINSKKERHFIKFKKLLLATGKNIMIKPKLKGLSKADFLFRHNVFLFNETPSKLAIIGCTPETLEVASIYSGLGVKVNLYEKKPPQKALTKLDRTGFNFLIKSLMKRNVNFSFETEIKEIQKDKKDLILVDSNKNEYNNSHVYFDVQEVFEDENLNLSATTNIPFTEEGIKINSQTNQVATNIYAFGSCAGQENINKYFGLYNFIKQELPREETVENFKSLGGFSKYLNLDFNNFSKEIKISSYLPVTNIGLSERQAEAIHGTFIKVELIENSLYKGFIKIICKPGLFELLGVTLAGDFFAILRFFTIYSFNKRLSYLKYRENIKKTLGV